MADARNRVINPLTSFRPAQVELLVYEVAPPCLIQDSRRRSSASVGQPHYLYPENRWMILIWPPSP
ncbi:MAG: hypothetical protein IPJ90_08255 [Anaerolineaceae bacterium]|nr:hypothetical protein [Anaerolineaceae bacterium]